jgi:hypothetical protein
MSLPDSEMGDGRLDVTTLILLVCASSALTQPMPLGPPILDNPF